MSQGHKVKLHVYDISMGMARVMSASILGKQIDAIYHTGVVVGDIEYFFGGGIQKAPPGQTPFGAPVEIIDLGETFVTEDLIKEFLEEMKPRFCQESYNLITNNCNNFSDEFASFLVGTGIPKHIVALPQEVASTPIGAMLLSQFQLPMEQQFSNVGQSSSGRIQQSSASNQQQRQQQSAQAQATSQQQQQKTLTQSTSQTYQQQFEVLVREEFDLLMRQGGMTPDQAAAEALRRAQQRQRSMA